MFFLPREYDLSIEIWKKREVGGNATMFSGSLWGEICCVVGIKRFLAVEILLINRAISLILWLWCWWVVILSLDDEGGASYLEKEYNAW